MIPLDDAGADGVEELGGMDITGNRYSSWQLRTSERSRDERPNGSGRW